MSSIFNLSGVFYQNFKEEMKIAQWVIRSLIIDDLKLFLFDNSRQIRSAMGENFFGVEEWSRALKYPVSVKRISHRFADELIEILNQPCPFEAGKLVKHTHILFPGVSCVKKEKLNLLWLQKNFPHFFDDNTWYGFQLFAEETLYPMWYLMYHSIVPGSPGLTYEKQRALLPTDYAVTNVIEEVVRIFLNLRCCQKSFVWPSSLMVRTRDFALQGRVCLDVRWLSEKGLELCVFSDENNSQIIGISSVKRIYGI